MKKETRKYADRAHYLIKAVTKRRKKIKLLSLEYKGNKCQICGYEKCPQALDFHHLNSNEKLFSIGAKGYTRKWESVQKELDKCILLCANCHREVHVGITQLPKAI
ncbi:hypothetical protein IT409_02550 [Candidatus Falkowbacteria bacterium]|nr:hypothetical protein [Candidatus Falkowbacteria bacterium]